jgi:DNA-directed RNA polymerase specialized sigma subunit
VRKTSGKFSCAGSQLPSRYPFEAALARLPSRRHAAVCRLIFRDDATQAEAGAALGITKAHAGALYRESIDTLRRADQRL